MKKQTLRKGLTFAIALVLYAIFFYFVWTRALERDLKFDIYWTYGQVIVKGWFTTLAISAVSLILALIVGLFLYGMRISGIRLLRYIAEIHKTVVFSTPLVVIAMVAYYYIGNAFHMDSKFWIGTFTLAFYTGAYISDVYQAAVESIHMNQWQTAEMFGFTKGQTYRHIIFPQVVTSILPPLAGQLAMTIKSSALLSYMGTDEYLNVISTVQSISVRYPEGFIVVAIGYWIITVPLIVLVRRLEQKLNYKVQ